MIQKGTDRVFLEYDVTGETTYDLSVVHISKSGWHEHATRMKTQTVFTFGCSHQMGSTCKPGSYKKFEHCQKEEGRQVRIPKLQRARKLESSHLPGHTIHGTNRAAHRVLSSSMNTMSKVMLWPVIASGG